MKKTLILALVAFFIMRCASSAGATVSDANHNPTEDPFIAWGASYYRLSVGNTDGWKFVPAHTKNTGSGEIYGTPDADSAASQIIVNPENTPEIFTLSLEGKMYKPGGTSGSLVGWSASATSKFFWLSPKEGIVKAGTDVTVTANGAPTESTWSVNSKAWKDYNNPASEPYKTSSITLNRNMWDKMQWTPSPVPDGYLFPPAGTYSVAATTTETKNARSDNIAITIVDVEFVTPSGNPVTKPSSNNEFVFDNQATGELTITLSASVSPSGAIDLLKDNAVFEVDDITGSTKTWHTNNPNGKATVDGNLLKATVTFTGLPTNNSSFGKKTAKITCSGNGLSFEKTNDYEVFFQKDATNNPGTNPSGNPNWFYYWKSGGVCGIPSTAVYDSSKPDTWGYCMPGTDTIIRLCPLAPTTNSGPETYTKDDGVTKITVTGQGKGIKCVAETVTHEQNHLTSYNTYHNSQDTDGDGIGDSGESTYQEVNTVSNDPDTYNIGGGYSTYGDDEIRCRKIELSPVSYDASKDWANPGCQSKNQFGPQP